MPDKKTATQRTRAVVSALAIYSAMRLLTKRGGYAVVAVDSALPKRSPRWTLRKILTLLAFLILIVIFAVVITNLATDDPKLRLLVSNWGVAIASVAALLAIVAIASDLPKGITVPLADCSILIAGIAAVFTLAGSIASMQAPEVIEPGLICENLSAYVNAHKDEGAKDSGFIETLTKLCRKD